jgi:cytosine/adenosine deaminase-related metal-dependent hydrolase
MTAIDAQHLLGAAQDPSGGPRRDVRLTLAEGRIAAHDAAPAGAGTLVLPAPANAHDHARVARASQAGGVGAALEAWLPYLALIPSVDPWLASAVAFGRSARGGAGAVMAHYTRVQGLSDYPTEAKAVAQAARDVGLRMAFAPSLRDVNPLVYDREAEMLARLSPAAADTARRRFMRTAAPAAEQVALVEAVAAEIEGDLVTVQFGPAGPQWCSQALLSLIAERSAATGRRVHMHLLETQAQRAWADATHPEGVCVWLDRLGLLSPRLSVAHGVWLRDGEMDLLAERGVTVVTNASSNLGLASGVARVGAMAARGVRVAIGLDGMALDEDEDALREMRLDWLLHRGWGHRPALSQHDMLTMATAHGRFAITGDAAAGAEPGAPADLLTLDWAALSAELIEDVPPMDVLMAKGTAAHVSALHVAGRAVVTERRVTGVDLPALETELLAALRAGRDQTADLRAAMPELRAAFADHFAAEPPCC